MILEELKAGGLLKGNVEDMMKDNLCGMLWMGHGMGHFLGVDNHDVGGYLPGHMEKSTLEGLMNLRTSRDLKAGMVGTYRLAIITFQFR